MRGEKGKLLSYVQFTHSAKYIDTALTSMAQWVGHHPANQKVAGLIPGQGTCLGCGPGPWIGVCERQPTDVSLTPQCFSPSLFPSLPPL